MMGRNPILWGLGVGAALVAVWLVLDGRDDPATKALSPDRALAAVKVPETLSAQAQMGARVYDAYCANCHGANAAGNDRAGPPLVHRIYEPGHHGDAAFVLAAQSGVVAHHWRFGNMPPVEGVTRADVMNIVAYIRELQRANGID